MEVAPVAKGGCFCEVVTFAVFALPVLSAFCHCNNCQRLTACPFVHTTHFEKRDFHWTTQQAPEALLDVYENPTRPHKRRYRCKMCGVGVASFNSISERFSVWGACLERGPDGKILSWEKVKPTAHQFYGTRMLDVDDDLGKWEGYEGKSARLV